MRRVCEYGAPWAAALLFGLAALAAPAAAQIFLIETEGQVLGGQSASDSSSTTIATQGQIILSPAANSATMRVGFNVNADAGSIPIATEIGILSFTMDFVLTHPANFDLTLDFLLRGQLLRRPDQEGCQGSIALSDISITKLVRVRDGREFPLDVVLPGASLDLDTGAAMFTFAEQDSRVIEVRGDPVEDTDYRVTFRATVTAISLLCEVSARFGADNGSTTGCDACVYPGFGDRERDADGLFVTATLISLCGNGVLDPDEACDAGAANGTPGACCDDACGFAAASVVCRPAAGDCDQSESCTGTSDNCPADVAKPAGSPCTADRDECSEDVCDDGGMCTHPLRAGTTCDAQNGCTCDHDGLFCTGPLRCPVGGGLCIVLPPPCGEDDTCDEERNICISPFGTATPTSTPSPAATDATPVSPTPTPTPPVSTCVGDCNGDGRVVVNELVRGVNLALAIQPVSACPAFDADRNGQVAINELVAGVNHALAGCRI